MIRGMKMEIDSARREGWKNELHSASLSRYRRFPRRKRSGRAVFSSPWEGEEKLYVLASAFELTRP